ncbi:MAG TPA: sulfite exporter TauE/SafE family protein [Acidimicrobiales bacterium]|nr:sulfite exporter TauE/SafE family protein [Acidimicrobiales bacterium]
MQLDLAIALAGLLVGFTVGLTGMGGGALMTPIMVLFFKVSPLAAVSSDLVVSLIMKPVGGGVHLKRGTVRKDIALWLCVGSVPAAFAGVLILNALGAHNVDDLLKRALGLALLASAGSILLRRMIDRRRAEGYEPRPAVLNRPLTVLVGVIGGLVVGLTSVGSGSLIIVMLLFLYPGLKSNELVGTDLVQAIPLVGAAAIGHMFFGAVQLALTASLLVGALPGVYIGARLSAHAPDKVVRPALFVVLLTSGLKLVQVI